MTQTPGFWPEPGIGKRLVFSADQPENLELLRGVRPFTCRPRFVPSSFDASVPASLGRFLARIADRRNTEELSLDIYIKVKPVYKDKCAKILVGHANLQASHRDSLTDRG